MSKRNAPLFVEIRAAKADGYTCRRAAFGADGFIVWRGDWQITTPYPTARAAWIAALAVLRHQRPAAAEVPSHE